MSMNRAYLGATIAGMGIVTYAIRLSFVLLIGHMAVPPMLQRALRFVPPAVLAALIFPDLFLSGGTLILSPANPRLLAGALAALIAWRSRNAILSIAAGMAALWLLQAALSG
jgi:branched-subunit amino acid transport protein